VAEQLGHEALAKTHHFVVRLALGVEVRTALAAAHGQGGERVLEHLLEAEELENGDVHARVQAQAALVGADCAVEFDAVAAVHLNLALVVDPGHAEHQLTLRLYHSLKDLVLFVLRITIQSRLQRLEHLGHCLMELRLPGIPLLHQIDHSLRVGHVASWFSDRSP
jgi:hypothetical protein